MCGIVGYFRLEQQAPPLDVAAGQRALASLQHRGPDGGGDWQSADGLCWLGHRRLSIIDIASGAQPMGNEDGTVWVTFNGEIYNFRQLRVELVALGHIFRTHSDTEVLVHGYEAWGATGLVNRLQGLFAFAIYDGQRRALTLFRDHMGVKPLYWWSDGKAIAFASEMKALLCFPAVAASRRVNKSSVAQYIVTRYAARPSTLLENIQRLPEGCFLEVQAGGVPSSPVRYWDVRHQRRDQSESDALAELDALLQSTIDAQLMSDVPLGVQLSGGVDSSLVVALMEARRRERGDSAPIKTFAVGFDIPEFSELPYARMVAERYGTEHHEIVVGPDDFIKDFARLCWLYDEPMGEPSAIPTYYMCKAAKEHVTVMLCGEGADEQFGGYSKYVFDQFSGGLDWMPGGVRQSLLRGMGAALPFKARRVRSILEILAIPDQASRFASWFGGVDTVTQQTLLHPNLIREIRDGGLHQAFNDILADCASDNALDRFLYCDIHSRLVDDILVKGDRMSMAAGIEARVPFLDHRVVEFAARLPGEYKVRGQQKKVLLKLLAEKYLPAEVIHRRKVGFTVPLTRWFTGPLSGFVSQLLLSERSLDRGYFRREAITRMVEQHIARKVDREQGLWLLITLEMWHRLFVDDDGSEAAVDRLSADLAPMMSPANA